MSPMTLPLVISLDNCPEPYSVVHSRSEQFMRTIMVLALAAALAGAVAFAAVAQLSSAPTPEVAVGPQYDSTHVYVAPADFDRFVASFVATFGGTASKRACHGYADAEPDHVAACSDAGREPLGVRLRDTCSLSLRRRADRLSRRGHGHRRPGGPRRWGGRHRRPVPRSDRPRRGDPVAGRREHAALLAHDAASCAAAGCRSRKPRSTCRTTAPTPSSATSCAFSQGGRDSDDPRAPGVEIGRPGETYRRVRLASHFGEMAVLVTDGHLP